MKARVLALLAAWLWGGGMAPLSAGAPPPREVEHAQIEWAVPTNRWPERLWVYRVVPQNFSRAVVSNLLAIAQFTAADESEAREYKTRVDKSATVFGVLEGTCKHLVISPTLGVIDYYDPKAEAAMTSSVRGVPEAVAGIPDQERATRLGLAYLRLLGVDKDQLATKPGSDEPDLHWERGGRSYLNEKTGKNVEDETCNFGVIFNRRVDGLNVVGVGTEGGIYLNFGNNGKIKILRVVWRNLQPYELHICPSAQDVTKWLKEGRLVIRPGSGRLPPALRRLTIYKASFLYDGRSENKAMDFVWPFVVFEASAAGRSSTNTVWFKAPLTLSESNWLILQQ